MLVFSFQNINAAMQFVLNCIKFFTLTFVQSLDSIWFICDLIGCRVDDAHHGFLGTVADVIQGPAQDVYVVRKEGESDLLFPALKSILQCVDIPARQIRVLLPDGLFDVYRT